MIENIILTINIYNFYLAHNKELHENHFGLEINLGVKDFLVSSNGVKKKNINKSALLKKLEKQLKREQRGLSRKYEDLKKRNHKMKGQATRQNIQKQVLKVQKLHHKGNDEE